jgi:hypothetical protein
MGLVSVTNALLALIRQMPKYPGVTASVNGCESAHATIKKVPALE